MAIMIPDAIPAHPSEKIILEFKGSIMPLLYALLFLALAEALPADSMHFCAPFDYEQYRRDHPRPAGKRLADLNVGAPRTVRMIYFLPNDRPYSQAAVDSVKFMIGHVRTFYANQMEAHGYGKRTFRFETDAQGKPRVHRVNGRHPARHYHSFTYSEVSAKVSAEVEEVFDIEANVYLIVLDSGFSSLSAINNTTVGIGVRISKKGGFALVASLRTNTVAHELGHAFGLSHDFRDDTYVMSYGPSYSHPKSFKSQSILA